MVYTYEHAPPYLVAGSEFAWCIGIESGGAAAVVVFTLQLGVCVRVWWDCLAWRRLTAPPIRMRMPAALYAPVVSP